MHLGLCANLLFTVTASEFRQDSHWDCSQTRSDVLQYVYQRQHERTARVYTATVLVLSQCHDNYKWCFCVDINGQEIVGTKKHNPSEDTRRTMCEEREYNFRF